MAKEKIKKQSKQEEAKQEETASVAVKKEKKTPRAEKVRGKKYNTAKGKVDREKLYAVADAVKLVKEMSYTKFDGSVEVHIQTKKDAVSVNVNLPHASGKSKKIEVADENTIEKLKTGKVDFDVLLTTADMMPKLVPFARILGPKGMMPNPKNGTLIKDKKDASKFSADTLTLKTEKKAPLIHTTAGKVSMESSDLIENIDTILDTVGRKQILKASIAASMSPSVKLAL